MTLECPEYNEEIISPLLALHAYREGYFPMADPDGSIYWHSPDPRAIIPLDKIKVPKSLRQFVRKENLEFRINTAFDEVITLCALREECWISEPIIRTYKELNQMGFAHSVETYRNGELIGGLYGVALGGAFFGESMFSKVSNASKAAFYYLALKLNDKGFLLLDSQYINPHTELLGAIEIPKSAYIKILKTALSMPVVFS
jgi:leucyl/phenylalanyl-tRNA--protein transferase